MLAANRSHDCLVVHARVRHQDVHPGARGNRASIKIGHLLGLAERSIVIEVNAARIGDHRNSDFRSLIGEPFEKGYARIPDRLRIDHHVCLADANKIGRIESAADLDLMIDCPLENRPHLAGEHCPLLSAQLHSKLHCCRPGAIRSDTCAANAINLIFDAYAIPIGSASVSAYLPGRSRIRS